MPPPRDHPFCSSTGRPRRPGAPSEQTASTTELLAEAVVATGHTPLPIAAAAAVASSISVSQVSEHHGDDKMTNGVVGDINDGMLGLASDDDDDDGIDVGWDEEWGENPSSGHSSEDYGDEDEDDSDDGAGDGANPYPVDLYLSNHHQPHYPYYPHLGLLVGLDQALDGFVSDDQDMSDDAGVPLSQNDAAPYGSFGSDDELDADAESESDMPLDATAPSQAPAVGGNIPQSLATLLSDMDPSIAVESDVFPSAAPGATPTTNASALPLAPHIFTNLPQNPPVYSGWWGLNHILPPLNPSPSPGTLAPSNYGLADFLRHWTRLFRPRPGREKVGYPWSHAIEALERERPAAVKYADLDGDRSDLQGINWDQIGVTRQEARRQRLNCYTNYVNQPGSDRWELEFPDKPLSANESFFRFRRMDIRRGVNLSHFQLRNTLACTSRSHVFYPGVDGVQQFNPVSGVGRVAMKLKGNPSSPISTIAAGQGVVIAGGFNGEYVLCRPDSDTPRATREGTITTNPSGITNHAQIHPSRTSSAPLAAFASNDKVFRVIDLNTETWLVQDAYTDPLNCTALSPDGRLRVMVGDHSEVLITAAESTVGEGQPEILQKLEGHRDFGFACDWADDGWTVATAFQDKSIKIWDARKWRRPVCTMRAEMAGVRGLRFSPIGSGKRVLVAAEEADYVSIIDAQTYRSKQVFDIFGEIGGISFTNEGQDLVVLCCDKARGGVMQLERCGGGQEASWAPVDDENASWDWPASSITEERRVKQSAARRRRKGAAHVEIKPF